MEPSPIGSKSSGSPSGLPSFEAAVATLLRDARIRSGLSLRELARRAGTSHATLQAYEKGRKTPGAARLLRILRATGHEVHVRPDRRVREAGGVPRGEGLAAVLTLAEQFPVRAGRHLDAPVFGRSRPGDRPWT